MSLFRASHCSQTCYVFRLCLLMVFELKVCYKFKGSQFCIFHQHVFIVFIDLKLISLEMDLIQRRKKKKRARPGFEPGTSRTLSENHTPRPTSRRSRSLPAIVKAGRTTDFYISKWLFTVTCLYSSAVLRSSVNGFSFSLDF